MPIIRHLAKAAYSKYPIPSVQDADDIAQQVATELMLYVDRQAEIPQRDHLVNKARYLCMDAKRRNHRLGFNVRKGDRVASVVSMDDAHDDEE